VEDVVAKVLKLLVGRLAAGKIGSVMMKENIRPSLSVRTAQMPQRIHSQPMVGATADGAEDDGEEERHCESFQFSVFSVQI
jgi:hypothetical protein